MTDQHGPVVGLLMGTERVVLVTGREAARQVRARARGDQAPARGCHPLGGRGSLGHLLMISRLSASGPLAQVMVDQADVFVKQGTAFFPGSALTGSGLLVSDGEVWRRQRRLSNPAFRKSTIDGYANAMVSCTQDLLRRRWVSGERVWEGLWGRTAGGGTRIGGGSQWMIGRADGYASDVCFKSSDLVSIQDGRLAAVPNHKSQSE